MTALQTHLRGNRRVKLPALPVVAVLCLTLLALLAVVQVAHFHSDATAADHCPLCVSLHSAVPVAVAAAAVALVQIGASVPVAEPRTVLRRLPSRLYSRPPPAGC